MTFVFYGNINDEVTLTTKASGDQSDSIQIDVIFSCTYYKSIGETTKGLSTTCGSQLICMGDKPYSGMPRCDHQ